MRENARIAEAMGWTEVDHIDPILYGYPPGWVRKPDGLRLNLPDFSSPSGFVSLLEWHAKEGRVTLLTVAPNGCTAEVGDLPAKFGPSPSAALVAATIFWLDSKEGGAR